MEDAAEEHAVQHVYDFSKLGRVPAGATSLEVTGSTTDPGESSTIGSVLKGSSVICMLARQPAGTGAIARSDPFERFNYVLQGTMLNDIEGDRVFASRGAILHTPADLMNGLFAGDDEDLLFFQVRDTRHRPAEARARPPGGRYVYDMRNIRDESRAPASAEVIPDAALRLPPGVTGKLLTGERLHVGVLRLEPGAKMSNYRKDNEQLVFVAEGELEVLFQEESLVVAQYCVLHVPAGTRHELRAPQGAMIVVAQDKGAAG